MEQYQKGFVLGAAVALGAAAFLYSTAKPKEPE